MTSGSGSSRCCRLCRSGECKPTTDLREVLNAIRTMVRSGGGWRMLPIRFAPSQSDSPKEMSAELTGQTIYWWFRRFVRLLLFCTIHDVALMLDRERAGREASPSGGILDSQSFKAPHGLVRGHDAGKKIVGRKRPVAVDADGRLLMVDLTSADVLDSAKAQPILDAIRKRRPWLKRLLADGAYDRGRLMSKAAFLDFVIEIVRRIDQEPDFKLLPRRLRSLLAAALAADGSSVCWQMMDGGKNVPQDGPLAPPGEGPRGQARCA